MSCERISFNDWNEDRLSLVSYFVGFVFWDVISWLSYCWNSSWNNWISWWRNSVYAMITRWSVLFLSSDLSIYSIKILPFSRGTAGDSVWYCNWYVVTWLYFSRDAHRRTVVCWVKWGMFMEFVYSVTHWEVCEFSDEYLQLLCYQLFWFIYQPVWPWLFHNNTFPSYRRIKWTRLLKFWAYHQQACLITAHNKKFGKYLKELLMVHGEYVGIKRKR